MALRRFRGASSSSTVVFTGQSFNRELLDTGSATGTNGSSVVLAAGASASFYITSATGIPNLTTAVTGSWEASIQFQTVTPTNIFCKFRVHRISVAGTVPTILASTEYSAEVQARATQTPYIISTDGTDLGTFSSGHRIAIEWTLRNAGAGSLSPQPSFGTYSRFVRTPIESTAAVGWTGFVGQAAYRPISYSEGTIKGVKRTGSVKNSITSTGTATGTKGGQDFSGSVTGVSTSAGTVTGAAGFTGSATGSSTSTGTIAAGTQGYNGAVSGSSTSTGTAQGTPGPGPQPQPEPGGSIWRIWNQEQPKERAQELRGRTVAAVSFARAAARGQIGVLGQSAGTTQSAGSARGTLGYYGGVIAMRALLRHRARGKMRPERKEEREVLILTGDIL